MLKELRIENFAIIEKLELNFASGWPPLPVKLARENPSCWMPLKR